MPAHNIGYYVPMIDGPEKVSGRAKYTADIVQPGHARRPHLSQPLLARRDRRRRCVGGLEVPGVMAIVTGADCDKTFGVLPIARSEHPLARDKVSYRGEPVAAVAALDDASAREAIRRIKMTVRELPAYYTSRRRARARRSAPARKEARQHRARRPVRARHRSRRASPKPTSCAKGSTIAPKSARTRWRCMPRSPNTTRCATA